MGSGCRCFLLVWSEMVGMLYLHGGQTSGVVSMWQVIVVLLVGCLDQELVQTPAIFNYESHQGSELCHNLTSSSFWW